jgi:hypothetical protein
MMESSGLSSVRLRIAGRVRRFFLMELFRSPSPPPETPGVRVFRAWRYWERNVRGVPFVATAVAVFFLVLGGILIGLTKALPWVSVLLILTGIGVPLALFPGKVAAFYPYAAELEEGRGLRLYSPLGDIYFPIEQVRRVRWSWVYGGWVVSLKRRYGLLSGFLIHFAWGRQGRELAQAIEEELARSQRPM